MSKHIQFTAYIAPVVAQATSCQVIAIKTSTRNTKKLVCLLQMASNYTNKAIDEASLIWLQLEINYKNSNGKLLPYSNNSFG